MFCCENTGRPRLREKVFKCNHLSVDVDLHTKRTSLFHAGPPTPRRGEYEERLHTPARPMRANKGHVTVLRAEPL